MMARVRRMKVVFDVRRWAAAVVVVVVLLTKMTTRLYDDHKEITLNGKCFRMGIVFRLSSMTTFKWLHFNYELLLNTQPFALS